MTPQLEQSQLPDHVTAIKFGGSILFKTGTPFLNEAHVAEALSIVEKQINKNRPVVMVPGGGAEARNLQHNGRLAGIKDPDKIDKLGIMGTRDNATLLMYALEEKGISAVVFDAATTPAYMEDGVTIYPGTVSGQTTDTILVQAAIASGQSIAFKMSDGPGLFERAPDGSITDVVVGEMPMSTYRDIVDDHESGMHTPFDKPATELALEHGIQVVLLPMDVENFESCLAGDIFEGTIFQPK